MLQQNNSKVSYAVECFTKKYHGVTILYSLPVVYVDHCNSNFPLIFHGFVNSNYVDYTVHVYLGGWW